MISYHSEHRLLPLLLDLEKRETPVAVSIGREGLRAAALAGYVIFAAAPHIVFAQLSGPQATLGGLAIVRTKHITMVRVAPPPAGAPTVRAADRERMEAYRAMDWLDPIAQLERIPEGMKPIYIHREHYDNGIPAICTSVVRDFSCLRCAVTDDSGADGGLVGLPGDDWTMIVVDRIHSERSAGRQGNEDGG